MTKAEATGLVTQLERENAAMARIRDHLRLEEQLTDCLRFSGEDHLAAGFEVRFRGIEGREMSVTVWNDPALFAILRDALGRMLRQSEQRWDMPPQAWP